VGFKVCYKGSYQLVLVLMHDRIGKMLEYIGEVLEWRVRFFQIGFLADERS
jgi:hypothetical protein